MLHLVGYYGDYTSEKKHLRKKTFNLFSVNKKKHWTHFWKVKEGDEIKKKHSWIFVFPEELVFSEWLFMFFLMRALGRKSPTRNARPKSNASTHLKQRKNIVA